MYKVVLNFAAACICVLCKFNVDCRVAVITQEHVQEH